VNGGGVHHDLLPAVCRQRLYEGDILQQVLGQPVPFA
jgi:hypothetical protein